MACIALGPKINTKKTVVMHKPEPIVPTFYLKHIERPKHFDQQYLWGILSLRWQMYASSVEALEIAQSQSIESMICQH